MNMFQLQERIKDFSKDQLVREMQQPSGAVPPFMVLSELQRRTRMEKAFQADQAQAPQSTVAQDAVNAAGVPQGGIADMARAMAPQTDMTGNTGAMPVQNMYGGGEVKRMQPGGLTGDPLAPYAQHLNQTYTTPKIENFVEGVRNMERQTFGAQAPGVQRAATQLPFGQPPSQVNALMRQQPAPPLELNAADPYDGMRGFGVMMDNPLQVQRQQADLALANQVPWYMRPPGANEQPPPVMSSVLPTQFARQMSGGGEVKRMQPGGLTGGARSTGNAELDAALAELERQRIRQEEVLRSLGLQGDEEGLSGVSADVGSFAPAALGGFGIGGAAPGPLSRIDANVAAPRTAPGLPSIRPTDAQPILNELAPPAFSDIASPATILGPEQGPNFPSVGDAARMRAINVTPGAGGFPSQRDLDTRFAQEQLDAAAASAATAGQTPDPTSIILSDGVMGPIDDRPTPIADAFRAELESRPARTAEAARMMAINEIPELSTATAEAPTDFSEFGGLPDFITDPGAYRGEPYTRVADLFGLGPAIDLIPTADDAADEIVPLTPDADTPRPVPRPDRGTTPPQTGGGGAGGAGGAGGTGGGAGARATGAADADKWLALAQFGLGLMSSQQPTLGGAIGEAGTAALGQLSAARKEAYERDLAERTLAARSASRPDRLSLSDRLDYITDQMENTRLAISMEVDPGRKMTLADDLASLQEQAAAILGASGPATARAAERFDVTGG